MLVVHNDDRPGMIGAVTTSLGAAKVNIADMHLGRTPRGEAALMVLSTDESVPFDVVEQLRLEPGIHSAQAIELD
jgi:D-3-phosphoglycerate dehydrogenase